MTYPQLYATKAKALGRIKELLNPAMKSGQDQFARAVKSALYSKPYSRRSDGGASKVSLAWTTADSV